MEGESWWLLSGESFAHYQGSFPDRCWMLTSASFGNLRNQVQCLERVSCLLDYVAAATHALFASCKNCMRFSCDEIWIITCGMTTQTWDPYSHDQSLHSLSLWSDISAQWGPMQRVICTKQVLLMSCSEQSTTTSMLLQKCCERAFVKMTVTLLAVNAVGVWKLWVYIRISD